MTWCTLLQLLSSLSTTVTDSARLSVGSTDPMGSSLLACMQFPALLGVVSSLHTREGKAWVPLYLSAILEAEYAAWLSRVEHHFLFLLYICDLKKSSIRHSSRVKVTTDGALHENWTLTSEAFKASSHFLAHHFLIPQYNIRQIGRHKIPLFKFFLTDFFSKTNFNMNFY